MLIIPHCLDSHLTDGDKPYALATVSLHRNNFMLLVLISVKRLNEPQGLVQVDGLSKLIKIILLIRSRTRDLADCSIVP
jgi:hypothetical protein